MSVVDSVDARDKILRFQVAGEPTTTDPAFIGDLYDSYVSRQVYDPLLQFRYAQKTQQLQPLLLENMPEKVLHEDGKVTYKFKLKQGVYFHDNRCFSKTNGKGRELVAADVFYSWKRMADWSGMAKPGEDKKIPSNWPVFAGKIVGFDAYHDEQTKIAKRDETPFNYDVPVEGLVLKNKYEFEVVLNQDDVSFLWWLARARTAVVPREAVEYYGRTAFQHNPVGTGPFMLADPETDWQTDKRRYLFKRNPNYHEQGLPRLDGVEIHYFQATNSSWLEFKAGKLDIINLAPEYYQDVFSTLKGSPKKRKERKKVAKEVKPQWIKADSRRAGIQLYIEPLLDMIYFGFNMQDPILGHSEDEKQDLRNRYLRQAIAYAIDWEDRNSIFYDGMATIYDGPIPPGLAGHPNPEVEEAWPTYRPQDLVRARELLAKAGYPDGEGLEPILFYISSEGGGREVRENLQEHLRTINVELKPREPMWGTFIDEVQKGKAQMFAMAWSTDYPDPENNLSIFYSENKPPGNNNFSYNNPEYDGLYREIATMQDSPERTEKLIAMRNIILEDVPMIGSLARTVYRLAYRWVKNFHPVYSSCHWTKYVDLDANDPDRRDP